MKSMRKHLTTFLKIAVTLLGLGYVLWKIPLDEIVTALVDVRWSWFWLTFVMVVASLVLRAYRWLLILQGLGVSVRFSRLVELYFVGNFFNAFLLSGFGGDAVRVLEVARDVPMNVAAGTVILDRMTGLLMLFVMALLAVPFRPDFFPTDWLWVIVVSSLLGLIGGFVLLEGSLIRRFDRWLPKKLSVTGDGPIAKLLQAVQGCQTRAIVNAMIVSTIFNLLLVAWWMTSGRALGYDIPYSYYLLVVPILSVARLVPSVSGLGVQEYLSQLLFVGAGMTESAAVALSLLVFLILRLSSILGAPVYIVSTWRQQRTAKVNGEVSNVPESQ